uniref:Uncharacterized protein n=1 Tax=Rhizophora mucronata TaxID=61149 RepID=A0A2P2IIH9_RHIMU
MILQRLKTTLFSLLKNTDSFCVEWKLTPIQLSQTLSMSRCLLLMKFTIE